MKKPNKISRTIEDVLNLETGDIIYSDEYFLNESYDDIIKMRSELQKAIEGIRDPLLTCFYCKQKVRIRGRNRTSREDESKTETFHFAHLKDSDECHIKTKNQLTKEEIDRIKYNGIKESALHKNLKEKLAEFLIKNEKREDGVTNVEVEKIVQSKVNKEWKKPDINIFYKDKRVAIELQLSTTWLNVITRRQHFYKENSTFILWIFSNFDIENETRKLTFDDVIFTNNQNAYVFDFEAQEKSNIENDLILKCYYKKYTKIGNSLSEEWNYKFIQLKDLHFDDINYIVYFYDSESEKKKLTSELESEIRISKDTEEKLIKQKNEQLKLDKLEYQAKFEKNRWLWEKNNIKKDKLIREYEILSEPMGGLINQGNKLGSILSSLHNFLKNIDSITSKVIIYFTESINTQKPFYDDEVLLDYLIFKYKESILSIQEKLNSTKKNKDYYESCLLAIDRKPAIEISGKNYSVLNCSSDYSFISRNLPYVKIINKNLVSGLFAENDLHLINNEIELSRIQYSNDILFLIDFTGRKSEFTQKLTIARGEYDLANEKLKVFSNKIQEEIQNFIELKIQDIHLKIEQNLNQRDNLQIELNKKLSEINDAN